MEKYTHPQEIYEIEGLEIPVLVNFVESMIDIGCSTYCNGYRDVC